MHKLIGYPLDWRSHYIVRFLDFGAQTLQGPYSHLLPDTGQIGGVDSFSLQSSPAGVLPVRGSKNIWNVSQRIANAPLMGQYFHLVEAWAESGRLKGSLL